MSEPIDNNNARASSDPQLLLRCAFESVMRGDDDNAESLFQEVIQATGQSDSRSIIRSQALTGLGLLKYKKGSYAQARNILIDALELDSTIGGRDSPSVSADFNHLAHVCIEEGDYNAAVAFLQKALEIGKAGYVKPEDVAADLDTLGVALMELRRFPEAESVFRRAITINGCDEDPRSAVTWYNLGELYREWQKWEEAKECFEKALGIDERIYGRMHVEVAKDLHGLADFYHDTRNDEMAEVFLREALAILNSLGVKSYERELLLHKVNTLGRRKMTSPPPSA